MPSSGFRNFRHWDRQLQRAGSRIQTAQREALRAGARTTLRSIQRRLPPGAVQSGQPHGFPGYAATGRTKRQGFTVGNVRRSRDLLLVRVGLNPNANRLQRIIAHVHEFGAVIRPRRAPALVFQVNGEWVRTQRVWIRPKGYFRAAWREARRTAPHTIARELRRRWPR